VVSPGIQRRNFTYIGDVINALILVGENGYGDEFGIGSNESFTIKEIAHMFLETEGKDNNVLVMLPERKGNRMMADVITAKTEALGWKSTGSIKDYISKMKKNNWK